MSYTILLLSKARRELAAAFQWYEERQSGLGDLFVEAVMHKLSLIEKNQPAIPNGLKITVKLLFLYFLIYLYTVFTAN